MTSRHFWRVALVLPSVWAFDLPVAVQDHNVNQLPAQTPVRASDC